jgi:hypothetical protein
LCWNIVKFSPNFFAFSKKKRKKKGISERIFLFKKKFTSFFFSSRNCNERKKKTPHILVTRQLWLLQEIIGTQLQVIPPGMDFSTVVVADAGDVVEGEVDSVAFTGDATNVVPVPPRVNPPIWDEVQFRTAPHHLVYNLWVQRSKCKKK